jgi:hypothetical protein
VPRRRAANQTLPDKKALSPRREKADCISRPLPSEQRGQGGGINYAATATGTVTSATGLGALWPAALLAFTRIFKVAPGVNTRSATVS